MSERVLITGSGGIVGSHVIRHLAGSPRVAEIVGTDPVASNPYIPEFDDTVPVYPIDIRDQAALLRVIREHAVTAVLHLAAVQGAWYDTNPLSSFEMNLGAASSVFQTCEAAGVGRVVYASSRAVYFALPESALTEDRTLPKTPYGLSKIAAECVGRSRADQGAYEFAGLRFADFVCVERIRRRAVRPTGWAEIATSIILAGIYRTPIRVRVPASAVVDLTYAGDLGELVGALLVKEGHLHHQSYNVGIGLPGASFGEFVAACAAAYGPDIYELEDTGPGQQRGVLDTSRLVEELGRAGAPVQEYLPRIEADLEAGRSAGVLPAAGGSWLEKADAVTLR